VTITPSAANQPVGRVVFSAAVNGVPDSFTPLDFELRQSWGQQDILIGRTIVPKGRSVSQLTTWPEGSPVQVTWGRPPQALQHWYGYLNHAEVSTSDDATGQNVQLTYAITGTSKRMLGDVSRTWTGFTLTGIAQNLARKYALRAVVTQFPVILASEAQANESDWCFLVRMARKYGARLWISGGTLYLINPTAVLSGASNFVVPTYLLNKAGSFQDSAQNFRVMTGDAIPGAYKMNHAMSGIDSAGNIYTVRQDGANPNVGDIIESGWHVGSPAEAKAIVNADAALAQFWQTATVELMGYGLLYPGKIIALAGNALPDGNAGNWLISEATHILKQSGSGDPTSDHYVTRCTLVRNQKGYPLIKGVQKISPELIPCALNGNVWQAQTIGTVIEGVL
jgi:hypothetical protein